MTLAAYIDDCAIRRPCSKAEEAFAAMDVDGDGELTAEEIYKALSKHDAAITMARVRELVARADVDKNGTVSRDEYLNAVASGENWTKSLRDFIGHDAEHQAAHKPIQPKQREST